MPKGPRPLANADAAMDSKGPLLHNGTRAVARLVDDLAVTDSVLRHAQAAVSQMFPARRGELDFVSQLSRRRTVAN